MDRIVELRSLSICPSRASTSKKNVLGLPAFDKSKDADAKQLR